jgi:hypothetical protein
MLDRPFLGQFASVIVIILIAIFISLRASMNRDKVDWHTLVEDAIKKSISNDATSCGFVEIDADRYESNRCVELAESKEKPYWVTTQIQGEDSELWIAYHKMSDGSSEEIFFDSYSLDDHEKPQFHVAEKTKCFTFFGGT